MPLPDLSEICMNCGSAYGHHRAVTDGCPDRDGVFQKTADPLVNEPYGFKADTLVNEKVERVLENGSFHLDYQKQRPPSFSNAVADFGMRKLWNVNTPKTFIDIGCGRGEYVDYFSKLGADAFGIDATPGIVDHILKGEINTGYSEIDMTKPICLPTRPIDMMYCIEVLEHINPEFEDVFIENLMRMKPKRLLVSWASPGQGGVGHVNEQPEPYVVRAFQDYRMSIRFNFFHEPHASRVLSKAAQKEIPWLKNLYYFTSI